MSSIRSAKHIAARKALKKLWRRQHPAQPRPPAPFLRNEKGFRFEKGVKRAR